MKQTIHLTRHLSPSYNQTFSISFKNLSNY